MEFSKSFLEWMSPYRDKMASSEKLSDWDRGEKKDFVNYVLEKMVKQCGGMSYFWRPEEENLVSEGWVEALEEFTAEEIIKCVYHVLEGKYRKGEHNTSTIPRTAFEFKCFVKNEKYNNEKLSNNGLNETQPPEPGEGYRKFKAEFAKLNRKLSEKKEGIIHGR